MLQYSTNFIVPSSPVTPLSDHVLLELTAVSLGILTNVLMNIFTNPNKQIHKNKHKNTRGVNPVCKKPQHRAKPSLDSEVKHCPKRKLTKSEWYFKKTNVNHILK